MKKTLSVLLALLIIAACLPAAGVAAFAATSGNLVYETVESGTKIAITDCLSTATGAVDIPATIDGKPVALIGNRAFESCTAITGITVPSTVTSIGSEAFSGCAALKDLVLTNGLTSIGASAFIGCAALTDVTLPKTVTSIGDAAFDNCVKLKSINIDALNTIYSSVGGVLFNNAKTTLIKYPECMTLTAYTVPATVTAIAPRAFLNAVAINVVTVPDSVNTIGKQAFYGTKWFDSQADGLVYAGKVAYKYKGASMDAGTVITLADGTTGIAEDAFSGCANLKNIVIPSSVVYIGVTAFDGCSVTINCDKGSYAETFAAAHSIPISYNKTPSSFQSVINKFLTLGKSLFTKLNAAFGEKIGKALFQVILSFFKTLITKTTA